jgi:autotransporter-associated beta strand protein
VPNALTVNGGWLQSNSGASFSGPITLAGNLQLAVGNGGAFVDIDGAISGAGGIVVPASGTGLITLGGSNTYTGATALTGGTLQLINGAALPDLGEVTLTAGSTLRLLGAETIGSLAGAAGSTVALGNVALTTGGNNASTTFAGSFTGGTGPALVKQGSGTFTLTGTSSVSAPVTVAAGTLQVAGAAANAGLGGINVGATAALDITGGASVANTVSAANGATFRSSAGSGTLAAGTLILADGAALNFEGGSGSTLTVGRIIANVAGGAPETVAVSGLGQVQFTQANTYTGGTSINGSGTATLAAAGTLGTGTVTVGPTAALYLNNATVANALTLQGGAVVSIAGNSALTGPVALTADSALSSSGGNLNVSSAISGAAGVNVTGANTVTLSGSTNVNAGTLATAGSNVLPDGGTLNIAAAATVLLGNAETIGGLASAGTLNLGANALSLNNAGASTISGSVVGSGSLFKTGAGSLTVSGTLALTGATAIDQGTLIIGGATTLADLVLSGTGNLGGTGALTVTNTFVVSGSSKTLGGSGTLTTQGASGVNLDASTGGTLTVTRPWVNSGALTFSGDDGVALDGPAGASLTNTASGTLVLNSTSPTAVTAASGLAVIDNQGTLLKTNATSTSLGSSGATSFSNSGVVLVNGGTLSVLGRFTQTGAIDVAAGTSFLAEGLTNAAGGELRGSGSIGVTGAGPLLNQGVIRPGGNVIGSLTFTGGLDLTGGTVELDISGTTAGSFDQIITSGPLQLGGTLLATLQGSYTPTNADFMPVLLASGSVLGRFDSTSLPSGFAAGYSLAAGEAVRLIYSDSGSTRIFTNAAGNLDWGTPANWGGTLPGPADEALISSGFAVTYTRGVDTIAALTINAANSLLVSGGSLSVTGATLLGGSVAVAGSGSLTLGGAVTGGGTANVSGGTLTLDGAASFASLNLTGGVLGGRGDLSVVGNFSRSGGALISSGLNSISLTQTSGALVPGELFAGSVSLVSQDPAQPLNLADALLATDGDLVLSGATVNVGASLSGQRVFINASNGVQLNAGASVSPFQATGDALVVASSGYFRNLAGASALSVGGSARWLVYSADPAQDNPGGLLPAFKQYNAAPGATPAAAGNGLLYALAPTLTATLQGTVDKVYDTTASATLAPGNFALSGALTGDTVTLNPVVSGSYTSAGSGSAVAGVGTGKTVQATGLSYSATDTATGVPVFGYQFSGTASGAVGSITPAALLVTGYTAGNKVYDGGLGAPISGTGSFTPLGSDVVTLAGTASGSFADKNVGTAKPVTLGGLSLAGPDAANYTLVLPTGLTADITARALTVSGLLALDRVYDAGVAATLGGAPVLNSVAGDAVTLAGTATASFADKNAGTAKPVAVTGYTLAGADAGNYTLQQPAGLVASITPRPLDVAGLVAANKVYDGTTTASLSGTPTVAPLAGDTVTVGGTALGSFADANVGTGKALLLTGLTLGGADGANYLAVAPASLVANITPATLSFVAAPLTAAAGVPLPPLSGAVTGFVGGDTLASATTGTLAWASDATLASGPGSYRIDGGGLAAQNYVFVQAAGNATALTLTPAPTSAAQATNINLSALLLGLQNVQVPLAMSTPTESRVLDVLPALAGSAGTGGPGAPAEPVFRAMNFSQMPRPEVQSLLAARERYKKQVFATGLFKLEQDPSLADVRACKTEAELSSGNCLITEGLKQEIQQIQARAARANPGQAGARQPERRRVRQAALPNIQRKLALLIGVNSYRDKRVPALEGAVPDARAVRTLLETRLGYEATVLEDPSREAIIRAFNKIALEADANDSVVIYYAGHGVVIPVNGVDTGFWLPSDTNAEEPGSWLSNADIAKMVAAVGSRQLMLVSDSCYSGSLVGSEKVQVSQTTDAGDLLSRKAAVVLSSGGNEPVADEGRDGHSIFAWHFMRALENVDNWQVGGNVFQRVRDAVHKEFPQTPQYGASRPAGHQGNTDFLYERREIEAAPKR